MSKLQALKNKLQSQIDKENYTKELLQNKEEEEKTTSKKAATEGYKLQKQKLSDMRKINRLQSDNKFNNKLIEEKNMSNMIKLLDKDLKDNDTALQLLITLAKDKNINLSNIQQELKEFKESTTMINISTTSSQKDQFIRCKYRDEIVEETKNFTIIDKKYEKLLKEEGGTVSKKEIELIKDLDYKQLELKNYELQQMIIEQNDDAAAAGVEKEENQKILDEKNENNKVLQEEKVQLDEQLIIKQQLEEELSQLIDNNQQAFDKINEETTVHKNEKESGLIKSENQKIALKRLIQKKQKIQEINEKDKDMINRVDMKYQEQHKISEEFKEEKIKNEKNKEKILNAIGQIKQDQQRAIQDHLIDVKEKLNKKTLKQEKQQEILNGFQNKIKELKQEENDYQKQYQKRKLQIAEYQKDIPLDCQKDSEQLRQMVITLRKRQIELMSILEELKQKQENLGDFNQQAQIEKLQLIQNMLEEKNFKIYQLQQQQSLLQSMNFKQNEFSQIQDDRSDNKSDNTILQLNQQIKNEDISMLSNQNVKQLLGDTFVHLYLNNENLELELEQLKKQHDISINTQMQSCNKFRSVQFESQRMLDKEYERSISELSQKVAELEIQSLQNGTGMFGGQQQYTQQSINDLSMSSSFHTINSYKDLSQISSNIDLSKSQY